jgi:hypothetical protein
MRHAFLGLKESKRILAFWPMLGYTVCQLPSLSVLGSQRAGRQGMQMSSRVLAEV